MNTSTNGLTARVIVSAIILIPINSYWVLMAENITQMVHATVLATKNKRRNLMDKVDLKLRRQHAVDWLLNAQKATPDGGVSAWYDLSSGYHQTSYPEVTGYIVPTMFDIYKITKEAQYRDSAIAMVNWIASIQLDDGAIPDIMYLGEPYVYEASQDVLGLVRAYNETGDELYKQTAIKAADWIVSMQRSDGSFPATRSKNEIHTYQNRSSWALLQLHQITQNVVYKDAAIRNLDWALSRQMQNGWFDVSKTDTTHYIAYSVRGLLESGLMLNNEAYFSAAKKVADIFIDLQLENGMLYGRYDHKWKEVVNSSCLTGDAQIAIIWLIFYSKMKEERYLESGEKIVQYLSTTQNITSPNAGIRGGIAGSHPIDGSYCANRYLSWATKFYIDAINLLLMLY